MKHIVGFSGGIDSAATAVWVLNRYPKEDVILMNSDAGGNEHPLTTAYCHWWSENVHPVVFVSAIVADLGNRGTREGATKERRQRYNDNDKMTFDILAEIKGRFPSRKCQFCTEHLKLMPQQRWIRENLKGQEFRRYAGVRRDESVARSKKKPVEWDDVYGCELYHPIVDWTKQMCFDYVQHHGYKVNELYTLGFERVGCAPCVNSGKSDILAWAQRSPEMIDKVREWEKRVGKTFFAPCVPGMEVNWVDDVVAWSKTTHGGKQISLLATIERPMCESDYGLCE